MRLFVGIPLTDDVVFYLRETQTSILTNALKSHPTPLSHFHLTLLFIGEVEGQKVDEVIDRVHMALKSTQSFLITLGGVGSFVKGARETVWMGINQGEAMLKKLHQQLKKACDEIGITYDGKKFNPHITLAREVQFIDAHEPVYVSAYMRPMRVDHIILYQSHRVHDRLTYTPLEHFELQS